MVNILKQDVYRAIKPIFSLYLIFEPKKPIKPLKAYIFWCKNFFGVIFIILEFFLGEFRGLGFFLFIFASRIFLTRFFFSVNSNFWLFFLRIFDSRILFVLREFWTFRIFVGIFGSRNYLKEIFDFNFFVGFSGSKKFWFLKFL